MSTHHNLLKALNHRPIAFYPIYKDLTESLAGGVLLSQIMYWASVKLKFWKTNQKIMEETGLSKNELHSAKLKLKTLPFLSITKEGLPAKTWYEIDPIKWQETVEQADWNPINKVTGNQSTVRLETSQHTICTKTTTKTTGASKKRGSWRDHPRWMTYAVKLASIVSQIRHVEIPTNQISKWPTPLKQLHSNNKISIKRIRKVLDWYCKALAKEGDLTSAKNKNTRYIPIAHSAQTFKAKFLNIEDAMLREEKWGPSKESDQDRKLPPGLEGIHKKFLCIFKEAGTSSVSGAAKLVQEIHEHRRVVQKECIAIRTKWERKLEKERKEAKRDPAKTFHSDSSGMYANAMIDIVLPQLQEQYRVWVVQQTSGWEGWEGSLQAFLPGEKHFRRYVKWVMKREGWAFPKQFQEMVLET